MEDGGVLLGAWGGDRTRDLDEVLQIHSIFLNVSKGQTAKDADLQAAFGTTDVNAVILEILQRGELQVGSEERGQQLQMMNREVATIVADKCVNPRTKTPYPVGVIEQAMAELHFSANLTKSAKQQALEVIKLLEKRQDKLPIARAQMRLLVILPLWGGGGAVVGAGVGVGAGAGAGATSSGLTAEGGRDQGEESTIRGLMASIEEEKREERETRITCLIDPGRFRSLSEAVTKRRGSVLLLSLKDVKDSMS